MTGARGAKSARKKPAPAPVSTLPATRYLFFGGKGGVGKTSAACAAALLLLERAAPGEHILLFSTDPAHSLSDSLDAEVGDRLVEVARARTTDADNAPRLFAREMDATRALAEFKTRHRAVLKEIADRGTLLDESDINELLDLSLPGMDEVMSLFELSEVERMARFARVVVDTAPSGHTTRLLRLPEVFTRWIAALDRMAEKHRFLVARFARTGRARADEVDLFLDELSERVRAVRAMLFDAERTTFTLVAIPEAMSVEETARYYEFLVGAGVPVKSLVVNRVEREHDACPYCRARVAAQARWLAALEERFASLAISRVPLLASEVRGAQALRRFASLAWETDGAQATKRDGASKRASHRPARAAHSPALRERHAFALGGRRLLIFGGKGGVGKTTAAASAALALAEADPHGSVLIFSTDPAHSLSDSFAESIGEERRGVAGVK
ncbi:MAG TPA: TRC40/GET3/ArsA family transport-energizing ATPase, partial [Pyrinomonadaceae bacterium]